MVNAGSGPAGASGGLAQTPAFHRFDALRILTVTAQLERSAA